jgi:RNA polymerase sigma-70 factor (ECF subfamily)
MSDELSRLYKMYGPFIYARCCKLLGDSAAAEDATQETFLRVERHLAKVPPESNEALAWIYRVATNYCLNELRNRKRRPEPRAEPPEPTDSTATASLIAGRVEEAFADRDFVRRVVSRVATKLRSVAWLYHVEGLDQQEVATTLGISRRTVVNRLSEFEVTAQKLARRLG